MTEDGIGAIWDKKFSRPDFAYGKEPNDWLRQHAEALPKGKILCLGDGEGRNSVYLARLGFDVTAVDASLEGLKKGQRLAEENGVTVTMQHADLADYPLGQGCWDGIISIFCHVPQPLRSKLHRDCVSALRSKGMFLLEGYTPDQVGRGTGGPPVAALMMTAEELTADLAGLDHLHLAETVRPVIEGSLHKGDGAVVQALARKP